MVGFQGRVLQFFGSSKMKGFHAKSNGGNTTAEVGYFLIVLETKVSASAKILTGRCTAQEFR